MWLIVSIIFCILINLGNAEERKWQQCGRWSDCTAQYGCCECFNDQCSQDSDCGWFNKCHENRCAHHYLYDEKKTKRSVCADGSCIQKSAQNSSTDLNSGSCACACVPEPPLAETCAPILPPCFGDAECQGNELCIYGGCVPINPQYYE